MKEKRRGKIIELIENHDIETQEELNAYLEAAGFITSQGTISRDIRDMNIIKVPKPGGKFKYAMPDEVRIRHAEKLIRIFVEGVISMELAGNLLVIKTLEGMAMAVAASIDAMEGTDIIGTIAGDDTIFCVVKTQNKGQNVRDRFLSIIQEREEGTF